MEEKDLQSPTLQISVLDKSLDSTSLQYEIQDRTLVRSPLSHVLLQDDHWPHEANSGESEQTLKNAIDAQRETPYNYFGNGHFGHQLLRSKCH